MTNVSIYFDSIEVIQQFIQVTEKYPYDIDVRNGNLCVDGKSILGVLSLGSRKIFELSINSADCKNLLDELNFCIIK